jgi:NAD(P)-dependent dehydrogenase (short-subunit alcohol dehydrogenase family)
MNSTRDVAIVTGGGSGIGRAAALALGREGYAVVVAGRRAPALEETVALGARDGSTMLAVAADVGDEDAVEALFATTVGSFGRVDLLFNNAGRGLAATSIEDISLADWQAVVAANLTGVFLCTRQAVRTMKRQTPRGGRIINNGSISAHVPRPLTAPYTATKHAISGLTKATALDCRDHDIACGQIDIGNAQTEMTDRFTQGTLQANGTTAIEPVMDVEAVARAVVYMASLPLDANVLFMTVMATRMPFVGRG